MSVWSTPVSWTASQYVVAAQFNNEIRQKMTWLKAALANLNVTSDAAKAQITPALMGAQMSITGYLQPFYTGAYYIPFDTVVFDAWDRGPDPNFDHAGVIMLASGGFAPYFWLHDPITASEDSYWWLSLYVEWAVNSTGYREIAFSNFGVTARYASERVAATTSTCMQTLSTLHHGSDEPEVFAVANQSGDGDGLSMLRAVYSAHRISGG
jgi:hypothetical protein